MEEQISLADLCQYVSSRILKAIEFINIAQDICEGDNKIYPLTEYASANLKIAFKNIEKCRNMISNYE